MRKRRGRKKFTWLPVRGSAARLELVPPFNQLLAQLTVPPNGDVVTGIAPLTIDTPLEGTDITSDDQLNEVIGSEYVVERIVGRCFLSADQPDDDAPAAINPKTFLIGAGFFVARANDSSSGGGQDTPIGSATAAERQGNYSVLSVDTVREPWMWHRTWILNTGRVTANLAAFQLPFSNLLVDVAKHNLNMSGLMSPHFDVKSVRRVRQDERLWFAISARTLDNEWTNTGSIPNNTAVNGVTVVLDYRILGALRKAQNRSNF